MIVLGVLGCASNPSVRARAAGVDSRPELVRVADSTSSLVNRAAITSDSANARARVALVETAPDRARQGVQGARAAAQNANGFMTVAIAQGDFLDQTLPDASVGAAGSSVSYSRYWKIGREKLDIALSRTTSALQAADLALACVDPECTKVRTGELRDYIEQAAGAAREAESLVRIAMVYVGIAMNYVR
jgi:hypothetical protein